MWTALPNYRAIVKIVEQIQTATPADVAATIKLDTGGRRLPGGGIGNPPAAPVTGVAHNIIEFPGVEFDVRPKSRVLTDEADENWVEGHSSGSL